MWVDKQLYWAWVEDRKRGPDGTFLTEKPPAPSTKRIDYVTINKGVAGLEHRLAIGVWDDQVYKPLHRKELEFHTTQHGMAKNMLNRVKNFEWTFCGQRYKFNWPAIIILGTAFAAVAIYQHYFY